MADGAPTFSVVWMLLPLLGCEKVDLAADACLLEESAADAECVTWRENGCGGADHLSQSHRERGG